MKLLGNWLAVQCYSNSLLVLLIKLCSKLCCERFPGNHDPRFTTELSTLMASSLSISLKFAYRSWASDFEFLLSTFQAFAMAAQRVKNDLGSWGCWYLKFSVTIHFSFSQIYDFCRHHAFAIVDPVRLDLRNQKTLFLWVYLKIV